MVIVRDVHSTGTNYVDDNNVLHIGSMNRGVIVLNASQMAMLPENMFVPGELAHTPGWKAAWEKNAGTGWKNLVGGEDIGA